MKICMPLMLPFPCGKELSLKNIRNIIRGTPDTLAFAVTCKNCGRTLTFLFNDKSVRGWNGMCTKPLYRRHSMIRSGRLSAINGRDRRCNRIGVTPGPMGDSAIRVGRSCSIGFHERGLMLPRRRGGRLRLYPPIDSRYPITRTIHPRV